MADADEDDIGLLVDNAVSAVKHANLYAHPKAFAKLNNRILSCGKSRDNVLFGVEKHQRKGYYTFFAIPYDGLIF